MCRSRPLVGALWGLTLVWALPAAAWAQSRPAALPADFEDKALEALNSQVLRDCLEAGQRLAEWSRQYDEIQRLSKEALALLKSRPGAQAGDPEGGQWAARVEVFLKRSPALSQRLGDPFDARLKAARAKPAAAARVYEEALSRAVHELALDWLTTVDADLQKRSPEFRAFIDYAPTSQARTQAARQDAAAALETAARYQRQVSEALRRREGPLAVELDLGLLTVTAAVAVTVAPAEKPPLRVVARAVGATAEFGLDDLSRLKAELVKNLKLKVPDMIDNTLSALADGERHCPTMLARGEKDLRDALGSAARRTGPEATRTGVPAVDATLGRMARGDQNLLDFSAGARAKAGRLATALPRDPGAEDQRDERAAERLRPLVAAVGQVRLDKAPPVSRHTGRVTELHLRFELAVAAAAGDSDGVLGFTVCGSGYRSVLGPANLAPGQQASGSDVRAGFVRFKNLLQAGAPVTAAVTLPPLEHGSALPAELLARDALADLIERLLPEVAIDGRHRERQLAIRNHCDEPVRAWVQVFTRDASARWVWKPAGPGDGHEAESFLLPPRQTVVLRRPKEAGGALPGGGKGVSTPTAVRGLGARLWAESESGRLWTQHVKETLWLVKETDDNGKRRYYAPEAETYTHELTTQEGPRTFRERVLRVHNATTRPVTVQARAQSRRAGGPDVWRAAQARVGPGQTVTLEQDDGWVLRGSKARLWAQDEAGQLYRWWQHKDREVQQVDGDGYRAEKIGAFLYVLEPPGKGPPERAPAALDGPQVRLRLPADLVGVADGKGKTAAPGPGDGSLLGTWVGGQPQQVFRFQADGTCEVGPPPPSGGLPTNRVRGRYTYTDGVLTVNAGNRSVKGKVQWLNHEQFLFTPADGRPSTYRRARW